MWERVWMATRPKTPAAEERRLRWMKKWKPTAAALINPSAKLLCLQTRGEETRGEGEGKRGRRRGMPGLTGPPSV
jgi:hypothetical protein